MLTVTNAHADYKRSARSTDVATPAGGQVIDLPVAAALASEGDWMEVGGTAQLLIAGLTPLIGRETECAAVCRLLRTPSVRMVTLTGAGGIGKTRLALQAAAELADEFGDGSYVVPLAAVRDPWLVGEAIAHALHLVEQGKEPLLDRLKSYLSRRRLLLVLDNFEHVSAAASLVAELLAECPLLKVLATSRASLRVTAEHEFAVPTLPLPEPDDLDDLDKVATSAAVELFVRRVQAVRFDFGLSPDNAAAVAGICTRLDGLPLAIELAAVRSKLLSPDEILARLDRPLELLTAGPRDLPARHRELRRTIGWSYGLLDAGERQLFRGLAVFAGGCTVEAAEAVLTMPEDPSLGVLDGLVSLVDHGLVQRTEGPGDQSRLEMIETIREFALEELEDGGDAGALRAAHAAYFLGVTGEAERQVAGRDQQAVLDRLAVDHANLRAALQWYLDRRESEAALRLCNGLWRFWLVRGHLNEGRRWLDLALGHYGRQRTPARAWALVGAGMIASFLEDESAAAHCDESLALFRELDDSTGLAVALTGRALIARKAGDLQTARALYEEVLRVVGPGGGAAAAGALQGLGWLSFWEGREDEAAALFADSLAKFEEAGDRLQAAGSLYALGQLASRSGDHERAHASCEAALAIAEDLDDPSAELGLSSRGWAGLPSRPVDRSSG